MKIVEVAARENYRLFLRFIKRAPLGDPIAVDVEGRQLSLRRSDAAQIFIQSA